MSYLVPQQPQTFNTTIRRFEPAYWEVDFNLEAVATIITTGPNSLRMKSLLRTNTCFIGLYWRSQDKWGHPLLSYQQKIDWRNCVLQFDLTYTGAPVINATTNGLVMTVTDMSGKPYYLSLANFMISGDPASRSGTFRIDFSTAKAGVLADQDVPWHFIDSVFIGFTSASYVKGAVQTPITELAIDADITNISVTGSNSTVGLNNTPLPAHELLIADGFADSYPLTPERIVGQIVGLGYRGKVVMYVGFTQYLSLTWDGGLGRLQIDTTKDTINAPSTQWLTDYCTKLASNSIGVTMSVSFELLTQFCPADWSQRDYKGDRAESGWSPSSTFVSPFSDGYTYLEDLAVAFVGIGVGAGCTTSYQVGEPWWWPGGYNDNGPCFYDDATRAQYTSETGLSVPTPYIRTIYDEYETDAAQVAYLTWLEEKLGEATLGLRDVVKAAYPGTLCTVLFYTPTISNPLAPMLQLVNFPQALWSYPAWDFVQVEDYEVVEFGNFIQQESDLDVPVRSLNYPLNKCEYFSGFNLLRQTTFIWDNIDRGLWVAYQRKGYSTCLVWSRPQVCLDGWVYNHDDWASYAAVTPAPSLPVFPQLAALGWSVIRSPEFNSLISEHVSGKEVRSPRAVYPRWTFSLTYEGLRSDASATYQALLSFFQSRKGRGNKFFFEDPKHKQATAQFIGTGDGYRKVFALCRSIGGYEEPIGGVNALTEVKVNGVTQTPGTYDLYYNDIHPSVIFDTAPADGATITTTFSYYFVCRFVEDMQSFEEFMDTYHSADGVKLITVKP